MIHNDFTKASNKSQVTRRTGWQLITIEKNIKRMSWITRTPLVHFVNRQSLQHQMLSYNYVCTFITRNITYSTIYFLHNSIKLPTKIIADLWDISSSYLYTTVEHNQGRLWIIVMHTSPSTPSTMAISPPIITTTTTTASRTKTTTTTSVSCKLTKCLQHQTTSDTMKNGSINIQR